MNAKSKIYDRRGVSSLKEEVAAAVGNNAAGVFPGSFCKAVENPFRDLDRDSLFLSHADGTGSKSVLAYMVWKETGELSVFRDLAQDAIVMNTDDLLCVGAIDNFFFTSTLARNKHRIPGEVLTAMIEGTQQFLASLREWGVRCELMGGETADLGDAVKTLTVDMNAVTFVSKDKFIDASRIRPGLAIVGLASEGQTVYERAYNSGIAANGLTSARHDLLHTDYRSRYPETYDEGIPTELVYNGRHRLEDALPGTPLNFGQALLSPTRTYLPVVKEILKELPEAPVAILHLTGGGQTKCLKFGKGIHYVKNNLFPLPPIFQSLADSPLYHLSPDELYQVFNCGHRLELYVEEKWVDRVISVADGFRLPAQVIGHTDGGSDPLGNALTLSVGDNQFHYLS